MRLSSHLTTAALISLLLIVASVSSLPAAVLAGWDFTQGAAGWHDEAGSRPQAGPQGVLWPGSNAGLSLRSPALNLPTGAFQSLEIALSFERPGMAQLLWQGRAFGHALAGWNGSLPVQVPADGKVHVLRLMPYWQNVDRIEGLRIVAAPGTRLRLQRLQIIGPDAQPAAQAGWDFARALLTGEWLSLAGGADLRDDQQGLQAILQQPTALLVSPPMNLPAFHYEWLSARLRGDGLQSLKLQWATSGAAGLQGQALRPRPGWHTYNVHCGADESWVGNVRGLALQLAGPTGTQTSLLSLGLHTEPQGAADLQTLYAGPVTPAPRVGRLLRFAWVLQNEGGSVARDVVVRLTPGEGLSAVESQPRSIARMDFGMPQVFIWQLRADKSGKVSLQANYRGGQLQETISLHVQPALLQFPMGNVPPPQAAAIAGMPLAVYYRVPPPAPLGPAALDRLLYHRPYLGDYDPQPQVMDWQIKWCLEHGISTWIMDTGNGADSPERAALDAFLASDYGRRMQFCLRWSPTTPTVAAGEKTLGRELAPLLAAPNYLRVDGKPLVLVANVLVRTDKGLGLADLSALSKATGLSLIACLPPTVASAQVLQRAGYLGAVDLHAGAGFARPTSPVEDWQAAAAEKIPHILCLQPAWRTGMTAQRLATLVQLARLRVRRPDEYALPPIIVGDLNGPQGLEPKRPTGFSYLEAVAKAVGAPPCTEITPQDLDLGPYDRPQPVPPNSWEFNTKGSWNSAMGLSVLRLIDGMLTGKTDTASPALFGGDTMLDTRYFDTIVIGLAASAGTEGRVWWRTSLRKFVRDHSLPFRLTADGAVHEYRLQVGQAPGWQGYLEGLRIDPTNVAGAAIALDYVRVLASGARAGKEQLQRP